MNAPGSGHVHGGRDGRMSFESDLAVLVDDVIERSEGELPLPSGPLANPSPSLDEEARAYFRRKVDAL